ncbi:MAG: HAMP domain-containing histidine kinase [Oscillospiraceae bacterium]|nr:HAMP domain-containing histidine kinase [Oscillospiraceae bacterium]
MKFWHKIFFGTLLIFIIAFDAGAFFLTSYSYDFIRQSEAETGIREQGVILSSVISRITSTASIYPDAPSNQERLIAVMRPLADYYKSQGVLLALFDGDTEVYADIPYINSELLDIHNTRDMKIAEETINGSRHIVVASRLSDYPHLTFVYARDISQIDDFRVDVKRVFIIMNILVLAFLGASIYLLLKRLTKPIAELKTVAVEIAGGEYKKRASTDRSDELGALADSFNRMADSVVEQMARLTKAAEDKQQFIDDLAHEIKTPLTSILGYSEYLQNAKSTEEDRIVAAGHLRQMALRLKNLSDKLLDIAFMRGENIAFRQVDVTALFSALSEIMRPILAPRNLNLIVLTDIAQINGDETLLLSMLQNLVENASRASNEGADIKVRAYYDNCPVIEVSDNGCGMEQQEIEKITAPFYRVDKSRSRNFGGVGLGLSIVSQIAALHGAKIEIESHLGEGTTIKIYFTTQ